MQKPKFDPQRHHRRSIRLKGYDYSSEGAYFVAMVTYHRDFLFGGVVNGEMSLNTMGKIADECWRAIPEPFPNVELGAYVIMPNHVHGIIVITEDHISKGAAMLRPDDGDENPHKIKVKPGSLGAIVRSYRSAVSYRANHKHKITGIWQRNYYEHIIRDEKDMLRITDYIEANPSLWEKDDNNPINAHSV